MSLFHWLSPCLRRITVCSDPLSVFIVLSLKLSSIWEQYNGLEVRKYFTLDVSPPLACPFSLPAAVCAALCVAQLRLDLLSLLGTEHTFAARCNYCISGGKVLKKLLISLYGGNICVSRELVDFVLKGRGRYSPNP